MSTVDYDSIRSLISSLIEDNNTQQISPLDVRASLNAVLNAAQRVDIEGTNYTSYTNYWYANLADLDSLNFYYFGGLDLQGNWKINRNSKTDSNSPYESATIENNPGIIDINSAWVNRTNLVYG